MTNFHIGPQHEAMKAHQALFGRFVGPAQSAQQLATLEGWENWVGDNGAFKQFDQHLFMRYVKHLFKHRHACRCLTVPDVPYQWEATLTKFRDWSPSVRRMGFPVGLAVQDGANPDNIPWCEIDALFVGGSTEWKRQQSRVVSEGLPLFTGKPAQVERSTVVKDIVQEARNRGVWVHMGRSANAPEQLWYAMQLGADSTDGTCELHAPNREFRWIAQTMWAIDKFR